MILYNGASGSLGRYLGDTVRRRGLELHAITARLEDADGLSAELDALEPSDEVTFIHLAGRVSVPACEADPDGAFLTNVTLARSTTEGVLEWAERRRVAVQVIYVSTGHVYAVPHEGSRLDESAPTLPRSVYARTKLAAEQAMLALAASGVRITIARVFGLIAPQQPRHYVLPGLVDRVLSGRLREIPGLDFARDYLDARDVCEDLVLLAAGGSWTGPQIVNVCSGEAITIRDLLKAVLDATEPEHAAARAQAATAGPGRPDDVRWLIGDPTRFVALTGVSPRRIPLEVTTREAVAEARQLKSDRPAWGLKA